MNEYLLSNEKTRARTSQSRSAFYADVAAGLFPRPVKIGRSSRWPSTEVDTIVRARIAGFSDEQLRSLVAELESARADFSPEFNRKK